MKKIIGYTTLVLALCSTAFAQVTKVGNDTLLDVAGWNVEWFGDATSGNGPSNEALQYTNVKSVIKNSDIDVWGLAEVSNPTTFSTLLADLADYDGVLSTFSQTQKTALVWKKSKFEVLSSGNVLTESTYSYDFASRAPLEVVLKSKDNNITDTLYFYVVHLKANSSGNNTPNYTRRKNAVGYLKTFLDTNRKGKKCFVLGDWNDDVDQSVVYVSPAYLESPFSGFVNDSAHYFFPSMRLSKAGLTSYPNFKPANMIDHVLITGLLRDSFYIKDNCSVLSDLSNQISQYTSTTSDHYPVLSRYNMKRYFKPVPPPTGVGEVMSYAEVIVYPNPTHGFLNINSKLPFLTATLTNAIGEIVVQTTNTQMDVTDVTTGIYFLTITGQYGKSVHKVMIQH